MLTGKKITLIVGGSIAAYKAAEIVRVLVKEEMQVSVVMTKAAQEFITPLTLQTLSGRPVATELFNLGQESQIGHIKLASEADVVLVAPATANLIAEMAYGLAGDLASSILLATQAPVIVCPAMNVNMWENAITQANVSRLRERGAIILEPEEGDLACGWVGKGRLAEFDDIVTLVEQAVTSQDLIGARVVVAAGPTREPIDPIRFLSNRSSGKMGFAIARAALLRGAEVRLVSGPTACRPLQGVKFSAVETARQMHDIILKAASEPLKPLGKDSPALQFIFMVAAVSDHRPKEVSMTKVKNDKTKDANLLLTPNPDILAELGAARKAIEASSGASTRIIGFAAETGEPEELLISAREKLSAKGADLMIGNLARDAFEKNTNRVWLIDRGGRQEEVAVADKEAVAHRILNAAMDL